MLETTRNAPLEKNDAAKVLIVKRIKALGILTGKKKRSKWDDRIVSPCATKGTN